ncbi:2688_t:CDS:2, partial [Racocetra fulgida]
MIAHLRSHNIVDSKKLKPETPQKRQATLPAMIKSNTNTPHKGERRKEIVKGVIEWILLDNEPLSAPRKKGFRRMMAIIDPKFLHFFDSPKQQERLEKAQIRVMERDTLPSSSSVHAEAYTEVYLDDEEVGEIDDGSNTESEKQLNVNTTSKPLRPIKDYGQKLKRYLPDENEWKLIEELVKTFEKFDYATEAFSAEKYSTLSVVYPIIELLKFEFAVDPNLPLVDDDYDLNDEYDSGSEDEGSEDEEDYTQDTLNIQLTIAQVKRAIYNSLWKYWRTSMFTGLITTLLDPRLKKMRPWSEELRKETIRICREEYNNIIDETPTQSTHSN